ncbi:LLM class flavin-dependent oxidoreductase [Nocardioides soli]|uniref:Alkanesulfonate monooxygenase SsuD/methylene tetrahydromethanopterin reductase-like flavin-dependent oxidoreductase (Luciferase family) n=1 Tax=Nocardioides soli TaxID=1036020 RepID=A0A7W4Z0M5_9ACTN|nr:LLM class flavin-dependent oxidoreductase [Nocardioides soli]MBB3042454.1 alkanesulfonate monooxygenase SsuD/methylene tetrahydromethanopterin reductase-like flavin-dependent oxidoreductase (luciferase family) [Nocardioides soli]
MRYGAHLPLVDLDGRGWPVSSLPSYARVADELGFTTLAANDHLVFQRPWLDGIVALASVVGASGDLDLATTVALPAVRGPAALAKAAAALDVLSGGRLVLGLGAGSSRADHAAVGADFDRRWSRFEEAVRAVRSHLGIDDGAAALEPRPVRPGGPPIWIASWGSPAGLRRVARLGDGWLASAYNTTPTELARGRALVAERAGRRLPCTVATLWTWVTDDERERGDRVARLADVLGRPERELAGRVLVGPPEPCAELLSAYAAAGADLVLVWPLADHERQLERVMRDVAPHVRHGVLP